MSGYSPTSVYLRELKVLLDLSKLLLGSKDPVDPIDDLLRSLALPIRRRT